MRKQTHVFTSMVRGSRNKSPATQALVFVGFVCHAADDILSKKVSLVSLGKEILKTGVRLLDEPVLERRKAEHGHGAVVHDHRVHAGVGTRVSELVLHMACKHHVSSFKKFVVVGQVKNMG
jgi:transketolase C-terminal domain/subunit